jgi:hypothetical protein
VRVVRATLGRWLMPVGNWHKLKGGIMNLLWVLVVIFLIFAFVGAPGYGPWHHSYGWYPSGIGTVIVIVLVVLLLTGRL